MWIKYGFLGYLLKKRKKYLVDKNKYSTFATAF
jgi:hypothetical protein